MKNWFRMWLIDKLCRLHNRLVTWSIWADRLLERLDPRHDPSDVLWMEKR